jgi:hypothetical protein
MIVRQTMLHPIEHLLSLASDARSNGLKLVVSGD